MWPSIPISLRSRFIPKKKCRCRYGLKKIISLSAFNENRDDHANTLMSILLQDNTYTEATQAVPEPKTYLGPTRFLSARFVEATS